MPSENRQPHYQSFLGSAEQKLVSAIVAGLPDYVTPLQLTRIGLFGAVVAAAALIGCNWSVLWLPLVPVGVFLNWFGIRLDGPLASYRKEEKPGLGLVDHTYDLFSQMLMILAFGFSPFLSMISAVIVLLCFLLFSTYTYIRAVVRHVRQMAYIGVGATEFRILMVVWAFAANALGIRESGNGLSTLDTAIIILAAIAVGGLAVKVFADARRIAGEEGDSSL